MDLGEKHVQYNIRRGNMVFIPKISNPKGELLKNGDEDVM